MAVSYHVEGWGWANAWTTPLWTIDTPQTNYLVGCLAEPQYVLVWAEGVTGKRSPDPVMLYWAAGGGRFLDDSNIAGGWNIPPMCGG